MNLRIHSLLALVLVPALAHCAAPASEDTGGEATAMSLSLQPTSVYNATINAPYDVSVQATVSYAAGCGTTLGNGRTCSGPHESTGSVPVIDAYCDEDLCTIARVWSTSENPGAMFVTVVPKAPHVTLHVTAGDAQLSASGTLDIHTAPATTLNRVRADGELDAR